MVELWFIILCSVFAPTLVGAEAEPHEFVMEQPKLNCCSEINNIKGYILNAIIEEESDVKLLEYNIEHDEAEQLVLDVIKENCCETVKVKSFEIVNSKDNITVNFQYDKTVMQLLDNTEVENEKKRILACVNDDMTDMEKALTVHDYMVQNYEYDLTYSIYSASGMFENKTGVCQAYALAYKEMMTELGIPCQYVTSRAMNHGWNLVKIDGEWYHVDVTWDDPTPDLLGRVRHIFFLISDDAISDEDYYERIHHSWSASNRAESEKYDNYFWYEIDKPLISTDGNWYYIDESGNIVERNIDTGIQKSIYKINSKWFVWGNPFSYWVGCYSGIGLFNNKIYFNTPDKIQCINLDGTDLKSVYTPDTSAGDLYGLIVNGKKITYGLSTSPNKGIETKEIYYIPDPVLINDLMLQQEEIEAYVGTEHQLTALFEPSNADNTYLKWESDNEEIATVDETGKIIALKEGCANITVSTCDGSNLKQNCMVTVKHKIADIMCDGVVNSKDLIKLGQYLARFESPISEYEKSMADIYKDGVINSKDLIKLSQYLAKWDITIE